MSPGERRYLDAVRGLESDVAILTRRLQIAESALLELKSDNARAHIIEAHDAIDRLKRESA